MRRALRIRKPVVVVTAGFALVLAATVAGCMAEPSSVGGSDSATSSSSAAAPGEVPPTPPEPTPSIPAYTLDELHRIVANGNACTTWTPATVEGGTGGWCQESMVGAFVFSDQASADALVQKSAASSAPQPFLVGNRWVITVGNPASSGGAELFALQDIIGGSLVGTDL